MTPEKIALKLATVELIKAVGGVEPGERYCRVSKTQLSDYGSVNRPDRFIPLDVVADLEQLTRERSGWPHVTQLLCQTMGGVFVAIPEAPATTGRLLDSMSCLSAEFNDVTHAVCHGLADGNFCTADAEQLEAQLNDVIRVAVGMRALAKSTKGGDQ